MNGAQGSRPFVLTYTSDEIDGVRSNKIKPVDYEKLRNIAAEKKFSAHKTLLKVKKFEHLSKQNKENHLLKQHKLVWQKEFIRLNSMRKRIQSDIEQHNRGNSDTGICAHIYQEFEDYQNSLETDFNQFKKATTEPVWNLREDLQYWMQENMADLRLGAPDAVEKHQEIRGMVNSVKAQQSQYTYDLANRRTLIIDRIKRQVPGKTRADIVEHENWWDTYKFFNQRAKAIMADWARDRRELMQKASSVFMEACVAHELEEVKLEYTKRHEALRDALYNQVKHWREQKMEVMAIQAEMWEQQRVDIEKRRTEEQEKETKRRNDEKQKVKVFQDERSKKRQEEEEAHKQRLAAVQRALDEQAVYDKERIKFREEQIQRKIEERKHMEEERDFEEQEKEYRLEMLREKVRVVAESNPERMMSDTAAWQAHQREEETVNIQKPLFNLTGFTSTQVTSDNRIRLEQKLREAGLHTSNYARQMMSKVAPPQQPRRDMESNVFKYD
ncbi:CC148-like protein [Mya arenaria]|uniref:CC148-like protein n=1 Tax=Mya arenaria TaxID=6604 RepID=A0ABY7DC12_MYAAR|nr:CC148-like protein [Mya arenaria]